MNRAPFQVLILPYRIISNICIEYAIFNRKDNNSWQAIAGGGENNEKPINAAEREAYEEANIPMNSKYLQLDSIASIPKVLFKGNEKWNEKYVIPEYSFGVKCDTEIIISNEHKRYKWLKYENAYKILKYDSNKTAIWELNQRIKAS